MSQLRYRSNLTEEDSTRDRHQPTYQQSCPAPQGAIALAVVLLVTGTSLLIYGAKHLAGHIIRTDGAGWGFIILGSITFIPGMYVTTIALGSWLGLHGFKYSQIPH